MNTENMAVESAKLVSLRRDLIAQSDWCPRDTQIDHNSNIDVHRNMVTKLLQQESENRESVVDSEREARVHAIHSVNTALQVLKDRVLVLEDKAEQQAASLRRVDLFGTRTSSLEERVQQTSDALDEHRRAYEARMNMVDTDLLRGEQLKEAASGLDVLAQQLRTEMSQLSRKTEVKHQENLSAVLASVQDTDHHLREEISRLARLCQHRHDEMAQFDVSQRDVQEHDTVPHVVERLSLVEERFTKWTESAALAEKALEERVKECHTDLRGWLAKVSEDQDAKHVLGSLKNLENVRESEARLMQEVNQTLVTQMDSKLWSICESHTQLEEQVKSWRDEVDGRLGEHQKRLLSVDLLRKDLDAAKQELKSQHEQNRNDLAATVKVLNGDIGKVAEEVEQRRLVCVTQVAEKIEELKSQIEQNRNDLATTATVLNGDIGKVAEEAEQRRSVCLKQVAEKIEELKSQIEQNRNDLATTATVLNGDIGKVAEEAEQRRSVCLKQVAEKIEELKTQHEQSRSDLAATVKVLNGDISKVVEEAEQQRSVCLKQVAEKIEEFQRQDEERQCRRAAFNADTARAEKRHKQELERKLQELKSQIEQNRNDLAATATVLNCDIGKVAEEAEQRRSFSVKQLAEKIEDMQRALVEFGGQYDGQKKELWEQIRYGRDLIHALDEEIKGMIAADASKRETADQLRELVSSQQSSSLEAKLREEIAAVADENRRAFVERDNKLQALTRGLQDLACDSSEFDRLEAMMQEKFQDLLTALTEQEAQHQIAVAGLATKIHLKELEASLVQEYGLVVEEVEGMKHGVRQIFKEASRIG